jgi:hypothetical protein
VDKIAQSQYGDCAAKCLLMTQSGHRHPLPHCLILLGFEKTLSGLGWRVACAGGISSGLLPVQ